MANDELPVKAIIPELSAALAEHPAAVLCAPPGSGKTTLVPLELLRDPWLAGGKILLLEPRRLAARAAAGRMASLLGERVGETVGYAIRLERRVSPRTRIEVVTEGILTRRLQEDPSLPGIGLVIFDEFHERNLNTDLGLALALDAQQGLREELRLLVMSATLDSAWVSELLGGAPVVRAEGRSYPITLRYLGEPPQRSGMAEQVAAATLGVWRNEPGDLLVFLPGVAEIRRTRELLVSRLAEVADAPIICPLYGDLPREEQERALRPDPGGRRRIVLTTSIAETSLTIEGVTAVVDSGWSRLPVFLPGLGLTRLETLPVSRAAADQRAGRAGRLGPGRGYRLWSETRHQRLPAFHSAEILQADLAPLVLELARWGVADPGELRWPEPPPKAAYGQARELLQRLGALDERGRLTKLGEAMARLPMHPRLAHMLLRAREEDRPWVCDLAALLSERDILPRRGEGGASTDIALRLRLLQARRERRGSASDRDLDGAACRQVDRVSRDWLKRLRGVASLDAPEALSLAQYLALAYPDRLAQQTSHGRFRLVSGRAVRLAEDDPLAADAFLVAARLDAGRAEGRVRLASGIGESEIRRLPELSLEVVEQVAWESATERVGAVRQEAVGALVLGRQPLPEVDPERIRAAMLRGVAEMGPASLPWTKSLKQWRERVAWLRAETGEEGFPDLSDPWLMGNLERWLAPWLNGIASRQQLQRLDLAEVLQGLLSWEQRQRVEREAPSHLQVPSGSRLPLRYHPGEAPVLAVRLQELFGLTETPRVCHGRVPVMLHLLSPAQRPIQITADLAGFWKRTYPEVKKELKGRYPKHYWPDDPLQASPTARAKPRK